MRTTILTIMVLASFSFSKLSAQDAPAPMMATATDTLVVVWSSGDPEVAEKVCFMYTHNAKKQGWFKDVKLIIWGPSAKLTAENEAIQARVKAMIKDGVDVEACVACARMYGVDQVLKDIGVDVKGMGTPLTSYLKKGYATLNF